MKIRVTFFSQFPLENFALCRLNCNKSRIVLARLVSYCCPNRARVLTCQVFFWRGRLTTHGVRAWSPAPPTRGSHIPPEGTLLYVRVKLGGRPSLRIKISRGTPSSLPGSEYLRDTSPCQTSVFTLQPPRYVGVALICSSGAVVLHLSHRFLCLFARIVEHMFVRAGFL